MTTPHFYKSSKGDEKDWGEGERAISGGRCRPGESCMQTVVSEGTGVAARSMAMTWRARPVRPSVLTRTAATSRRTTCRPLWALRRHSRPRCCAISHSMERRAGSGCRRCAIPVHYGQRARRAGYPAPSRGLHLGGLPFDLRAFTCPAPRAHGTGIQYADSIIRFTGELQ